MLDRVESFIVIKLGGKFLEWNFQSGKAAVPIALYYDFTA